MIQSIRSSYTVDQVRYQLKQLQKRKIECTKPERRDDYDHSIALFQAALKGM
jgi:hypothetical protein